MEARAGWAAGCDRGSQTTIPYRYKVQNDRPGHDVYLTEPRRLVPRYASQSVLYEASARPGSWLGLPGLSTPVHTLAIMRPCTCLMRDVRESRRNATVMDVTGRSQVDWRLQSQPRERGGRLGTSLEGPPR